MVRGHEKVLVVWQGRITLCYMELKGLYGWPMVFPVTITYHPATYIHLYKNDAFVGCHHYSKVMQLWKCYISYKKRVHIWVSMLVFFSILFFLVVVSHSSIPHITKITHIEALRHSLIERRALHSLRSFLIYCNCSLIIYPYKTRISYMLTILSRDITL